MKNQHGMLAVDRKFFSDADKKNNKYIQKRNKLIKECLSSAFKVLKKEYNGTS